ncbi:MAG: hypothetical protein M5R40_02525 [Anaerolineae bacterium]|nr:hypothetical protein [Anaerolineae bacterium]
MSRSPPGWRGATGRPAAPMCSRCSRWRACWRCSSRRCSSAGCGSPHGGGDLASFLWPTYAFAARELRAGGLPLWNPHLYSGAPFIADNQSGVFYPPNVALFLLAPSVTYEALEWLVIGHLWLAGAGMYVCLRALAPSWGAPATDGGLREEIAALFGAVAFMLSDVFVTHQGNLNLVAVAAYLPLVFLCAWRALMSAGVPPQLADVSALMGWRPLPGWRGRRRAARSLAWRRLPGTRR